MKIEHVNIFTPEHTFRMGSIETAGENIERVRWDGAGVAAGDRREILYAVPGFIDLHLHGCLGRDVCDAETDSLQDIAVYQLQNGVTGFAPAVLTLPEKKTVRVLHAIRDYVNHEGASDVLGIHMEGPFISPVKKGAQDERYILPLDRQLVREFVRESGGLLKILGLAPEQNGISAAADMKAAAAEAAAGISGRQAPVHISLAHTNASYEQAADAFAQGADHVTHLLNAMPVFHHREPGVVGAAFDACVRLGREDVTVELICDGIHVHPAMVRAMFRMFGSEHIIMVSDSISGTGFSDGRYKLGELDVEVRGGRAALCTENVAFPACPLAGSVTNLFACFRMAVGRMGIPLKEALPCVTENPAKKLSVFTERGSIEEGKLADILLLDRELHLKSVIKSGVVFRR